MTACQPVLVREDRHRVTRTVTASYSNGIGVAARHRWYKQGQRNYDADFDQLFSCSANSSRVTGWKGTACSWCSSSLAH
ncbi:hypothetical protein Pan216_06960 [Planctomycetes bacterium Pan216]|uniref:Uncharacterized protein n=1 Tax=Kolteria novifilia TaxID=2527975 RepID=A0A518AYR3_9BACT|nr:hypothetical protein Pan216_06960 [Planctomycetes bacterium Pan216]